MKLYIIGNGFDLHHGLKTSYYDYRNFLVENHPQVLRDFLNFQYFTYSDYNINNLWSDLENYLTFNYFDMISDAVENGYPDLSNDSDSRWYEIQYDLENQTRFINEFTRTCLLDWLFSINTDDCIKRLNLDLNALFITFNYTYTLENVYSIDANRILHIHGALDSYDISNNSLIQFGSIENNPQNAETEMTQHYSGDDFYNVSISPGIDEIVGFCSSSSKNLKQNYSVLKSFISNNEINEVIIMGHSFLGIDTDYYKDILIPQLYNCSWNIYVHSEEDYNNAHYFISKYGLKNCTITQW